MSEIGTFEYGKSLKEMERNGGIYPVMGSNGIVGYHDDYLVEAPCIIIGRKGSAGAITWVDKNCYPIDTTFYINLKTNEINLRYLFHLLTNIGLAPEVKAGGVPGLNRDEAYRKKIPIPPLAEQERIVAILDKFDALTHDIKEGLPAEIKVRRQQYEYYRNKLLSFEGKSS
jgi:type I restriction enzyme S subunit